MIGHLKYVGSYLAARIQGGWGSKESRRYARRARHMQWDLLDPSERAHSLAILILIAAITLLAAVYFWS